MSACSTYAPMIGSRPGELSPAESRALAAHLAVCATCGSFAAALASTEGLLRQGLLAGADARDFASFADGIVVAVTCAPRPSLPALGRVADAPAPRLAAGRSR
jgi:hypothetical protein